MQCLIHSITLNKKFLLLNSSLVIVWQKIKGAQVINDKYSFRLYGYHGMCFTDKFSAEEKLKLYC